MSQKLKAAIAAALAIFLAACNSGNAVPDENTAETAPESISETPQNSDTEQESIQENSEPVQGNSYSPNEIIFPAHEMDKTEYNAQIFEIPKFTASFDLPTGWTTGIPNEGEKRFSDLLWSPVNIYDENGEVAGTAAFNTFIIYDDTTEENFHRMVYNQLMLGSVINWEEEYVPVKTDSNGEIAVVRIRDMDLETGEPIYYPAILAYDSDLLVYIGIQFDVGAVTEQQLFDIAESITFVPYDTASFIDENENAVSDS